MSAATKILALLFSLRLTVAEGQESTPNWTIRRFQTAETLSTQQVVQIKNPYGDLRCRAAFQQEVEILANIQKQEEDPYEADIHIEKDATRLMIEVLYVRRPDMNAVPETDHMKKRRIDMTLIVPLGAQLKAQTLTGLIEAKGLHASIQADSVSGDIVLSTKDSAQARTERGAINVTLLNPAWSKPPRLETVTGSITVWLPQDMDATIEANTEGIISTDYSIEIRRKPSSRKKTARATLGEGSRRLTISSIKGDVRLLQHAK